MSRRVIVSTPAGMIPGKVTTEDKGDGYVYVVLDQGSQGNYPVERVQDLHEQDLRPPGLEFK
jgi:hypothetical protein